MSSGTTHRFYTDHTYTGGAGLREISPPPWTPNLPAEFRYPYDALEHALPALKAEGLRFYLTKEAYALPAYGRDVVGVLLQEERCKAPVYGRHVRAVIRNLHSRPFLGWRPHLPLTKLEAVLTFEYARDWYTSLKSRRALAHPPPVWPAPVRREPAVIPIPLGYHSQVDLPQTPMRDRSLDLFFSGQVTEHIPPGSYKHWTSTGKMEARKQVWAALRELQKESKWRMDLGDIAAGSAAAGAGYSEKMMQSRLCIAPRGSMADTFRAFEGLRAGCLVVANPLPRDRFFYPGAPVLFVDHWREVGDILARYARDLDTLEEFRARGLAWWHAHLRPEVMGAYIAEELNAAGASLL